MQFSPPLIEATLLKRYKRFFADIELSTGEIVKAHVPNTGSLKTCLTPPQKCWVSHTDDPKRKLKYTLHSLFPKKSPVGVNTQTPNALAHEVWLEKRAWNDFDRAQREVKISENSRVDLVLWKSDAFDGKKMSLEHLQKIDPKQVRLVEVKNVTMAEEQGRAQFPDSVTTRGQKHLEELMDYAQRGFECELLFVVQREDCKEFSAAAEIDPQYSRLLKEALGKGVRVSAWPCQMTPNEFRLLPDRALKIIDES